MPKKVSTDPPEQVLTAEDRGQMLRHLISRTGKSVPTFAREAGLNRTTVSALVGGQNDVENAERRTAERILLALGMADDEVADALRLSAEARENWRTVRPAPVGGGDASADQDIQQLRLLQPLMGEVVLPPETVISVDAGNMAHGIQIVRLLSGELFSMKAGPSAEAAGAAMGRLLRADFAAVL